jgi:hypothetical protein
MLTLTAVDLYQMGLFNHCSIIRLTDGSDAVFCSGVKAPRPFYFHRMVVSETKINILYNEIVLPEGYNA